MYYPSQSNHNFKREYYPSNSTQDMRDHRKGIRIKKIKHRDKKDDKDKIYSIFVCFFYYKLIIETRGR